MGNRKKSKVKKGNTKRKGKNDIKHDEIRNMIASVSDDVCLSFGGEIPSDEALDKDGFPPADRLHVPSIEQLGNTLLVGVGEWGDAWGTILESDRLFDTQESDNYAAYSEEKKAEFRRRMVDVIRRSMRERMYIKWCHANHAKYLEEWDAADWGDDSDTTVRTGSAGEEGEGTSNNDEGARDKE